MDGNDISDMEIIIHSKCDRIDYDNLTRGEIARLKKALSSVETIVDRINSGYYKKMREELKGEN